RKAPRPAFKLAGVSPGSFSGSLEAGRLSETTLVATNCHRSVCGRPANTFGGAPNGPTRRARRNIFAKFSLKNRVQVAVSATVFRSVTRLDDVVQFGGPGGVQLVQRSGPHQALGCESLGIPTNASSVA